MLRLRVWLQSTAWGQRRVGPLRRSRRGSPALWAWVRSSAVSSVQGALVTPSPGRWACPALPPSERRVARVAVVPAGSVLLQRLGERSAPLAVWQVAILRRCRLLPLAGVVASKRRTR